MLLNKLFSLSFWQVLLVTCTILGAFGGFPEPPKLFQDLTKYQLVQWGLVFALVYQGGAGQDPVVAGAATLVTMILYKSVRALETGDEGELLQ